MFDSLKCAAELNKSFGFALKNVEGRNCSYYYAHQNNTLLERCKLVATTEDLTKIKNPQNNTDIIESCSRERANIKWKFYKLTNNELFAALLEEFPVGCKDTVLPDRLVKNHSVKCLTFQEDTQKPSNDNLFLFRALALHLHGNERLEEETSNLINLFLRKISGIDPAIFRSVCMEDISPVEGYVWADIFLYDFVIVDGYMIGELARRSVGKQSNTVRLIRYISHICYVFNVNALLIVYRCP